MWYWVINNKLFTGQFFAYWMCGLLFMVVPAIAVSEGSQYSMQKVAEQSNPWALPQKQESKPGYQQQPYNAQPYNPQRYDHGQQYQPVPDERSGGTVNRGDSVQTQPTHQWQPQTDRFVTPQFLDSLKKQQQYFQVMPENQHNQRPAPGRYVPAQPESGLPGQGVYGYPSYGSGSVNPLYDAPAVSPWGQGPDVLYRGESFPLVPSEAMGGFPPMHVPSFGMNNFKKTDPDDSQMPDESNVFNPFTFLPK